MSNNTTIQIPVTLQGETREVTFTVLGESGHMAVSAPIFGARIGRGEKTHRASMDAWPRENGWEISKRTTCLNKQAVITEWADEVRDAHKSQHNGSAIS